jgi:hypothetical protein
MGVQFAPVTPCAAPRPPPSPPSVCSRMTAPLHDHNLRQTSKCRPPLEDFGELQRFKAPLQKDTARFDDLQGQLRMIASTPWLSMVKVITHVFMLAWWKCTTYVAMLMKGGRTARGFHIMLWITDDTPCLSPRSQFEMGNASLVWVTYQPLQQGVPHI